MTVRAAPVSSISSAVVAPLMRTLTMMGWPGVKRMRPVPAGDAGSPWGGGGGAGRS